MRKMNSKTLWFLAPLVLLFLGGIIYKGVGLLKEQAELARIRYEKIETANGMCIQWANKLDGMTSAAGVYIKYDGPEVKDPWENALVFEYSRGGTMEILNVRCVGPDGKYGTSDDIVKERKAVNFSGIGSGIRDAAGSAVDKFTPSFLKGKK